MQTQISIRGYLVGPIWQPGFDECWRHFNYDLTREDKRFTEPGTLHDHMLSATRDGDFQSTVVAQGELIIQVTRRNAAGETITRTRSWPLDRFPSIRDFLHPDPDWSPAYPDDDE